MKLLIIGHKYQYEMLKLTQIFYPNTKIDLLFSPADTGCLLYTSDAADE